MINTEAPSAGQKRAEHLDVRVSKEEKEQILKLAQDCGLSPSNYIRKVALGHRPKRRMTDLEANALCSLADARSEIVSVRNALSGLSKRERFARMMQPGFIENWIDMANNIINRWNDIIQTLKS